MNGFKKCNKPGPAAPTRGNNPYFELVQEFAKSGDECWGRTFSTHEEATKAAAQVRSACAKFKKLLVGVRVMQRREKVYLVREGAGQ